MITLQHEISAVFCFKSLEVIKAFLIENIDFGTAYNTWGIWEGIVDDSLTVSVSFSDDIQAAYKLISALEKWQKLQDETCTFVKLDGIGHLLYHSGDYCEFRQVLSEFEQDLERRFQYEMEALCQYFGV